MISFNFKPHFFTLIILILNLLSLSFSQESQQQPIVTLPNGNKLIGIFQNSLYTNKKFAEFRGIPYAQAARFQVTKPAVLTPAINPLTISFYYTHEL